MAFAGSFGAAANLIPFAMLQSKLYGQASGYDANGNLRFTTPGGTVVTPERIDSLVISAITAVSAPLGVLTNNTDDGTAVDTGVLATGVPAANQHGLPANFGLGRGRWSGLEVATSLRVEILVAVNTVAAGTNTGGPVVRTKTPIVGGNFTVAIKNMSEVVLASGVILVQFEHSIQP